MLLPKISMLEFFYICHLYSGSLDKTVCTHFEEGMRDHNI